MNRTLLEMANIAREQADNAGTLAHLCIELTDTLDAIAEAILREPVAISVDNSIPDRRSQQTAPTRNHHPQHSTRHP